jgi:hypothetical protein
MPNVGSAAALHDRMQEHLRSARTLLNRPQPPLQRRPGTAIAARSPSERRRTGAIWAPLCSLEAVQATRISLGVSRRTDGGGSDPTGVRAGLPPARRCPARGSRHPSCLGRAGWAGPLAGLTGARPDSCAAGEPTVRPTRMCGVDAAEPGGQGPGRSLRAVPKYHCGRLSLRAAPARVADSYRGPARTTDGRGGPVPGALGRTARGGSAPPRLVSRRGRRHRAAAGGSAPRLVAAARARPRPAGPMALTRNAGGQTLTGRPASAPRRAPAPPRDSRMESRRGRPDGTKAGPAGTPGGTGLPPSLDRLRLLGL